MPEFGLLPSVMDERGKNFHPWTEFVIICRLCVGYGKKIVKYFHSEETLTGWDLIRSVIGFMHIYVYVATVMMLLIKIDER